MERTSGDFGREMRAEVTYISLLDEYVFVTRA